MSYKCPKCGEADSLVVLVTTWAALVQEEGNFQTDTDSDLCPDHNHEWENDAPMQCRACGHVGTSASFDTSIEEDDGPGNYDVDICRTGYSHNTFLVVGAASRKEAIEKALERAGDTEFREKDAEYEIVGVRK